MQAQDKRLYDRAIAYSSLVTYTPVASINLIAHVFYLPASVVIQDIIKAKEGEYKYAT